MCHNGRASLHTLLREAGVEPQQKPTVIGVHLRLGDIVGINAWVVTPEWLRRALARLGSLLPGTKPLTLLVFCGDLREGQQSLCDSLISVVRDMNWGAGRHATVIAVPTASVKHTAEHDMAILWACDHVVITWGTFGCVIRLCVTRAPQRWFAALNLHILICDVLVKQCLFYVSFSFLIHLARLMLLV